MGVGVPVGFGVGVILMIGEIVRRIFVGSGDGVGGSNVSSLMDSSEISVREAISVSIFSLLESVFACCGFGPLPHFQKYTANTEARHKPTMRSMTHPRKDSGRLEPDSFRGGRPSSEILMHLESCMSNLSGEEQALVRGKYSQGKSYKELAVHLDTTPKAVESHLSRIRKKLKNMILIRMRNEDTT